MHNQDTSGVVPLQHDAAWQWVASYHYDPGTDWIFILAQPTLGCVSACLFSLYAGATLGIVILARQPWRGANELRRQQWLGDLSRFAIRVDNFIRDRDPVLPEPPYPFTELMPIVLTAPRWLMPQWKKAEAFPNELALDRKLLELAGRICFPKVLSFSMRRASCNYPMSWAASF